MLFCTEIDGPINNYFPIYVITFVSSVASVSSVLKLYPPAGAQFAHPTEISVSFVSFVSFVVNL